MISSYILLATKLNICTCVLTVGFKDERNKVFFYSTCYQEISKKTSQTKEKQRGKQWNKGKKDLLLSFYLQKFGNRVDQIRLENNSNGVIYIKVKVYVDNVWEKIR